MRNSLPNRDVRRWLPVCLCMLVFLTPTIVMSGEPADRDGVNSAPPVAGAKATRNLPIDDILVIPAAAFRPDGNQPTTTYFPFSGGYRQGDSSAYGCLVAPVYLPNGARIMDFFASVYDDDATFGITVNLRRADNFAGGTDTLGSAGTTGAGAFAGVQVVNDSTINFPVVAYPDYSYYLTACLLSSNIRLYSVRIYLDVVFVDGFESGATDAWSVTSPQPGSQ